MNRTGIGLVVVSPASKRKQQQIQTKHTTPAKQGLYYLAYFTNTINLHFLF